MLHRLAELEPEVRAGYERYDFQDVFQRLFTFATTDLSAFYFDIRKDALYCDAADSLRRRACLTVMDALFHRLVTWLAPMLVFTMEEVWLSRFPGEEESVHLQDFAETPDGMARRCSGQEMGNHPRGTPRGERCIGGGTPGQDHRRLARGRTHPLCQRPG